MVTPTTWNPTTTIMSKVSGLLEALRMLMLNAPCSLFCTALEAASGLLYPNLPCEYNR